MSDLGAIRTASADADSHSKKNINPFNPFRQQHREILRDTSKPYTKVLSMHVTSVSIMQQNREILRNTNNPYTKVLNIYDFSIPKLKMLI